MCEQWKTIENYPNYEISSFGNLRRTNNHRSIKQYQSKKHRYLMVRIYNTEKGKLFNVHNLVGSTFLDQPCCPTCGARLEINHIDNNPSNNRVTNLEYVTRQRNVILSREKSRIGAKRWQSELLNDTLLS